jgi:ABC-type Fe3+-hydroxamate transport system substrate-binding protein
MHKENAVLCLVLEREFEDGGYAVVDPNTRMDLYNFSNPDEISEAKQSLRAEMAIAEHDVSALVEQLFEKNAKPTTLTLPSAPGKGYLIDQDGHFRNYFLKDGGGWERWYEDNPKAHGSITVSRPAIDEANGLVLVYTGTQFDWEAGSGWIVLYEYKDGKLKELKRVMLWIS